jgi:hypothetical protein
VFKQGLLRFINIVKQSQEVLMSKDWESTFTHWAKGPAATEAERCENSIRALKNAVAKSDALKNRNIEIVLQGSYRNRVNIRQDSDVDLGIICRDTFYYHLPEGVNVEGASITPATYHYAEYKNDVENALVNYFGRNEVTRGNKAFDIKSNYYRVEADLAPFFEYRNYWNSSQYAEGVKLYSDSEKEVINYPEQHYSNGVSKNDITSRRYKRSVRILKNLNSKMEEDGYNSAKAIPGFLVECLAFNVPNENFSSSSYTPLVRSVLAHIYNNTRPLDDCSEWFEVNKKKYLFHGSQPWTKAEAHQFISNAWNYIGYE